MTTANRIQIVTVYSAADSPRAKSSLRLIGLVTLLVGLYGVYLLKPGFIGYVNPGPIDQWLAEKYVTAGFADAMSLLGDSDTATIKANPDAADDLPPPPTAEEMAEQKAATAQRATVRTVAMYAWWGLAMGASIALVFSGLLGVAGVRLARRLMGWSACLVLLSACSTVAGIWIGEAFAGMPAMPLSVYLIKGGIHSIYGWVLLLALRLTR